MIDWLRDAVPGAKPITLDRLRPIGNLEDIWYVYANTAKLDWVTRMVSTLL